MKDAESEGPELTPGLLLRAYGIGVFPMADSAESEEIYWVDPRQRGILPLDGFHLSRSLKKTLRREVFAVTVDRAFGAVLDGCADREETWINPTISRLYRELHAAGHAHSVEVWEGHALVGGLYGVRLGAAFFGESMFSRVPDASKVALAHLVARLRAGRFTLLDTQFTTDHLERLGAVAVSRAVYRTLLTQAVEREAEFYSLDGAASSETVIQLITQTS